MANQLENEDLVIQLPWTVPQQPLIQTAIVVENPNKKMELDLNHSTDTTAISSFEQSSNVAVSAFDYATGIAVFLALCATGLAYWFGVKSFKQTEKAFHVTVKQIQDSTRQTLESNMQLYKSQENLKLMEIKSDHRQDWINKVRELFIEILTEIEIIHTDLLEYSNLDNVDIPEYQMKVDKKIFDLQKKFYSLKLYLNETEENTQEIYSILGEINSLFISMYNDYYNNKDNFEKNMRNINKLKMEGAMRKLLKQEWEKVKKGE